MRSGSLRIFFLDKTMDAKKCNTCSETKPITQFPTDRLKNGNISYRSRCKKCKAKSFTKYKTTPTPDIEGEIWVNIVGYEGIYKLSDFGGVKSYIYVFPRRLHLSSVEDDYKNICLWKNKKKETFAVHRLVALHFIPNPDNKPFVNHKNGIKWDNRVENLEWCTTAENIQHAVDTGLLKPQKGSNHGGAKLTEKQVLEIRAIGKSMFQREIAKIYNIKRATVSCILSGKSWTHI